MARCCPTVKIATLWGQPAYPGDVIFVPVRTGPSLFDKIVAIAGVVSSFGVTALTIKAFGG